MKTRPGGPSKLVPSAAACARLAAEVENCVVLLREPWAQAIRGGYSILEDYVRPLRLRRAVEAIVRFEPKAGKQAQVDFGHFAFTTPTGQRR